MRMSDVGLLNSKAGQDCLDSIFIVRCVPCIDVAVNILIFYHLSLEQAICFAIFLLCFSDYSFHLCWGIALPKVRSHSFIAASFVSLSNSIMSRTPATHRKSIHTFLPQYGGF